MIGVATLLLVLGGAIVIAEWLFRRQCLRDKGRLYIAKKRLPLSETYVQPHPYLSFSYRPNCTIDEKKALPYSLHPYRYFSNAQPLRLNNYGHFGDDFFPTRDGELTVACLGASGTANNVSDGESDYSFPGLLQDELRTKIENKQVRVMNCGIGGWNSADMLVNYALNIIHLRPTFIVIYQGMLDLDLYLMRDFRTDYSHGRRNLGEVIARISAARMLPSIPSLTLYEKWREEKFGSGNVRDDVLRQTRRANPDYSQSFSELTAEERNFRSIIALARESGSVVILTTFAFFNYDGSQRFARLSEGVALENQFIRRLAAQYTCPLVDLDGLIPKTREYFLDSNHFTPAGMRLVSQALAEAVLAFQN